MADISCNHSINGINNSFHLSESVIQAQFMACLMLTILSTFVNVLIIITFIVEKSLRKTFSIFIINLAIVDLLTSIFRMGFKTFTIIAVEGRLSPYGQAICNVNGVLVCRYIAIVI